MDHAEISVVMPVYNAEEYLREALDCVLDQDFTAYKLYCVDDASGDGSYEILQEYEKRMKGYKFSAMKEGWELHIPEISF